MMACFDGMYHFYFSIIAVLSCHDYLEYLFTHLSTTAHFLLTVGSPDVSKCCPSSSESGIPQGNYLLFLLIFRRYFQV